MINDAIGGRELVLIGDNDTRTVRAYDRDGQTFEAAGKRNHLSGSGGLWKIEEEALIGPDGTRLGRVPGHISYWFAWDGYLGVKSQLYDTPL